MNLTRTVLRRPVATFMVILSLIVFGMNSVLSSKLELTPDMEMPMLIVFATYAGASPDDIDELVVKPIEDSVGTLSGVKSLTSMSAENYGIVLLQYNYEVDIDDAYDDLKKKMDIVELPDDVDTPTIMEMDINSQATVTLAVNNDAQTNLYNYVNDEIVPEFEKLADVASVDLAGGREQYIRIELMADKLNQYHLNMSSIISAIGAADFTIPAGSTQVGGQDLSVSVGVDFDTMESLKKIPITVGSGDIIYLEDVANVYNALEAASGIGRYNGQDTVVVSIKKQQSAGAVDVSREVAALVEKLTARDSNLVIHVVSDMADQINNALSSVFQTMIMAVVVSMIIIFLFFGEIKASLIVGTSIPLSILATLVAMSLAGFSLNMITMGGLVLGVGMMVDNSIVVLESCFRATEHVGFREYSQAALEGSGIVLQSIIGSTITTCVVFLPLAMITGISGQMFKPLGFTIVFCMLASLISAMTIVPLCYTMYRPKEREKTPLSAPMHVLQEGYRSLMPRLLKRRGLVILASVVLLVISFLLAGQLGFELMAATDGGEISMTIETKPGLKIEELDKILQQVEKLVAEDEDVESYMLSYGSSGLSMDGGSDTTLTAYLKDDRKRSTDQVINEWKKVTNKMADMNITMESVSSTSASYMSSSTDYSVYLDSLDYEELKRVSDEIVADLQSRPELTKVHSNLENGAPLVKIDIDPIKAAAEGLAPASVGSQIYLMLSGKEATTLNVNGNDVSVKVEYPEDEYMTLDQLKGITLPTATGGSVALADIAEISFKDSPNMIIKYDKQYRVTISGNYTEEADLSGRNAEDKLKKQLNKEGVEPHLTQDVSIAVSSLDEYMSEELGSLGKAVAIAVFLVFIVMAMQFESAKFSVMVMTTIPFALIGSFGLLFLFNCKISMTSMLGFLMLVGTVVNNGILYVDTVNQYRSSMTLNEALTESGATRLRPILMTTLTTIVAMLPMAAAYGNAGEMMQGLALVDVGGLVASTTLSLLMLPAYYSILTPQKKRVVLDN